MTLPGRHVALGLAVVLLGGPAVAARVVDPGTGEGGRDVPSDSWVFDGTAFPRPGRLDLAAGSTPLVVGNRDPLRQPFDTRDVFNMPLSSSARYADADEPAAAYWTRVRAGLVNHRNGWSVEVVRTTVDDPIRTFTRADAPDAADSTSTGTSTGTTTDRGRTIALHVPDDFTPPRGSGGRADGATVLVQPDGTLVDLYRPVRNDDGHWTASRWVRHQARGTGVLTGVRAAGVSYAEGLIRAWELEAVGDGRLDRFEHRLAISIPARAMKPAPEPSDGYVTYDGTGAGRDPVAVWPANTQDDQTNPALEYRGDVPMGTTVAIPRDVDVEELGRELDVADDPWAMATLRTLQTFGGVVTDASETHALYAEPSADTGHVDGVERAWTDVFEHLRPVRGITPAQPGGGPAPYLWDLAPSIAR